MPSDYDKWMFNYWKIIISPLSWIFCSQIHIMDGFSRIVAGLCKDFEKKGVEAQNIVCLMYFRKQVVHCFQIA